MKRLGIITFLVIMLLAVFAEPVLAYLTNPSSMSIESVRSFRNCAVTGDTAIVFHGKVAFAGAYPTTPASGTIGIRLYNGTTLLKSTAPYVYSLFETYGYGDFISVFYLTTSDNITWGSSYRINMCGYPAFFTGLTDVDYYMAVSDWNSAATDQTTQRDEFYDYIIELCNEFQGIYPDVPLKTTTDGEIALSVYGESYFLGAIPGLYAICPQLFFSQIYVPTPMDVQPYTNDTGDQYGERTEEGKSDIKRGADRLAATMGAGGKTLLVFVILAGCIGICVWTMRSGWGIEPGIALSVAVGIFAALWLGDTMWSLIMIGSLIGVMGIMFIFFQKRA